MFSMCVCEDTCAAQQIDQEKKIICFFIYIHVCVCVRVCGHEFN